MQKWQEQLSLAGACVVALGGGFGGVAWGVWFGQHHPAVTKVEPVITRVITSQAPAEIVPTVIRVTAPAVIITRAVDIPGPAVTHYVPEPHYYPSPVPVPATPAPQPASSGWTAGSGWPFSGGN